MDATAPPSTDLRAYYAARAAEYERIYRKPERQRDLAALRELIPTSFKDRNVLEIACGTGYWTRAIACAAQHVTATDINDETLGIARVKAIPRERVTFGRADVYALPAQYRGYSGAFAGFWWSHVPRSRMREFLDALHRALEPGAVVVALDNRYVEGSSTPISQRDAEGNTYQRRRLSDGSEHVVLKNFPPEAQLNEDVGERATAFEFIELEYYWVLRYITR